MKKLALALVCLVSVAFFASCQKPVEHPEPTIAFLVEEGYISSDVEISTGDTAMFCIKANSNALTNKLLKSFYFQVFTGDERFDDTLFNDINQGTFEYAIGYIFEQPGVYTISAVATDADGYRAECRLNVNVNATLNPSIISWVRKGANLLGDTEAELTAVGLQWTGSYKEIFATIKPLEGTELYVRDGADFANLLNDQQMANYYSTLEAVTPNESYRNITTAHSADYNDMLFTKDANGDFHAVLIQHAAIETGEFGTQITITGAMK